MINIFIFSKNKRFRLIFLSVLMAYLSIKLYARIILSPPINS
nr:MAG TPA: hypothetical protein [Caudoviricetes sp.]